MAVEYNTVPEDSPLLVAEAPKKSGRVVAAVAALGGRSARISPPPGSLPATQCCVARPAPDARRVKPIAPSFVCFPSFPRAPLIRSCRLNLVVTTPQPNMLD